MSHDEPVGLTDDPEALAAALAEDQSVAYYDDGQELSQVDLESDARMLTQLVDSLDRTATRWAGPLDLERALIAYQMLNAASSALIDMRKTLADRIARAMGHRQEVIEGVGVVTRHRKKTYTQWKKEELLHDVLDTRMVDSETGELLDESPIDKVLAVWNLGAPRVTVLEKRGLSVDEYCVVNLPDNDALLWDLEIK